MCRHLWGRRGLVPYDGVGPVAVCAVRYQDSRGQIQSRANADAAVVRDVAEAVPLRVHDAHTVRVRRVRGANPPHPVLRGAQVAVGINAVADGVRRWFAEARAAVAAEQGNQRALCDAVFAAEADLLFGKQENLIDDALRAAAVYGRLCYSKGGIEEGGFHLCGKVG